MIARNDRPPREREHRRHISTLLTEKRYGSLVASQDMVRLLVRNPDELFAEDPQGYDRVLGNPVVQAEFDTLVAPIVNAEVVVEGFGDETDQALTAALQSIPCLDRAVEQLLYAYFTGFRVAEIVWGVRQAQGVAYNVPIAFEPHDHRRFAFDENRRLWMTQDFSNGVVATRNDLVANQFGHALFVHPAKLLAHSFRDGDGRYGYGRGEAKWLYRLVRLWDATMAFWADYNQLYGNPIKALKVDAGWMQEQLAAGGSASSVIEDEKDNLANLIESDAWVGDSRNELVLLQPGQAPTGTFLDLLNFLSEMIKLRISGQALTSSMPDAGSYAMSVVAQQATMARRGRLKRGLETTLTEQLLAPILWFNRARFSGLDPRAQGRVKIKASRLTERERIELAMNSGTEVTKDEWYSLLELTKPTQDQIARGETITPGASKQPEGMGFGLRDPVGFGGL